MRRKAIGHKAQSTMEYVLVATGLVLAAIVAGNNIIRPNVTNIAEQATARAEGSAIRWSNGLNR